MRIRSATLACLSVIALLACQTQGTVLESKKARGALLGTLAGAAAGAAIGVHEHRAGGMLIGAAAGALAGAGIGAYL